MAQQEAEERKEAFDWHRKITNPALRLAEYPPLLLDKYVEDKPPPPGRFWFYLARFILRMIGWRVGGYLPNIPKGVIIGFPHTSNWDGFMLLVVAFAMGLKTRWLLKDTAAFFPIIGTLLRSLGAIGVNRRENTNFVDTAVKMFKEEEQLFLIIAPEGTRSYCDGWKTGFYRIAEKAGVPILPGYVDYKNKVAGVAPQVLYPSGNVEADFGFFREFYRGVEGKNPAAQSQVVVAPKAKKQQNNEEEHEAATEPKNARL